MRGRPRSGVLTPMLALAAMVVWASAAPSLAAAQQFVGIPNGASPVRVAQWVAIVNAHQPGRADAAATDALSFKQTELAGILYAVDMVRLPVERAEILPVLARGAVLHTDVAVAQLRGSQRADEASRGGWASVHIAMAEGLVGRLAFRASAHPLINPWYVAVGSLLSSQLEVASAPAFLERALAVLPGDPQLLLLAGAAHELRASPRVQDAQDLSASTRHDIGDARQNLRLAEAFYRRALSVAPTQVESRIRLGRVLGLTGRHQEALTELQAADQESRQYVAAGGVIDRPLLFYQALLLGEEQDALNRPDDARRSYARALELYPGASSAWLDLSRLEWRSGARAAAAAAIGRIADPAQRVGVTDDPWTAYFCAGPARNVDAVLQALGAAVGGRR
jgi:tetratricopeptide (TPR) repeat protein